MLVGGIGAGKTAAGLRLLSLLRSYGIQVGGILAPRILKGEETVGYSIIDLSNNTTHPFAGLEPDDVQIGKFYLSQAGLDLAQRTIIHAADELPVVFVDEVGRLEVQGVGHAPAILQLLESTSVPVLLVRDTLVEQAIRVFEIADPFIFHASEMRETEELVPGGAQTFWQIVDSIPYPLLVTICSADGFPHSRPMHLVDHDGTTMWFATSRASHKIKQISADSRVTVLFVDSVRYNYASFHGHARIIEDADRQKTLWRNEWEDDWPDGPSDPDYVLIRIDGLRGHFLRGYTGESGEIELA
ncbi:pyridoxamine 5'-phosphate oxidase family protein [Candidatus Bipolaricaulota bacterium]|nr:pyridoxamine 5'-phosphate oxidase family protein [Candidatus Bipolaricaulota bacterium]